MNMVFPLKIWNRYNNLSPVKFSFTTAAFSISSQIVFFLLLVLLLRAISSPDMVVGSSNASAESENEFNLLRFLLLSVLVSPVLETLIFQYGLIIVLRKIIRSRRGVLCLSAIAFGALHLRTSELSAMQALISGSFFAYAFIHWYDKTGQPWLAARVTCLSHMLHNLVYLGMNYIPASVLFGMF